MSLNILGGVDGVDVRNDQRKLTLEFGEVDGQVYVAINGWDDGQSRGCVLEPAAAKEFSGGLVNAIARANAKE